MVASPFTLTLNWVDIDKRTTGQKVLTASDVAAAFALELDGTTNQIRFGNGGRVQVTDMVLNGTATDTNYLEVFANGVSTGRRIYFTDIATTAIGRALQRPGGALKLAPGSYLGLVQRA